MADIDPLPIQPRIIRALLDPRRYPHPVDVVEHIETHISHILLAGDFAYKIKKPLDLGFLDFGTLERRRFCCDEELRLNRRLAPELYLESVGIGGVPESPLLGAPPCDAIEYAVKMRRFPQSRLMDRMLAANAVRREHVDQLADKVAAFHERIERCPPRGIGTAESMHRAALENFDQLAPRVTDKDLLERVEVLRQWTERTYPALRPLLAERASAGCVRDGHGDLHAGNIALLDDGPMIFDCVEFAPELRWMDVLSEAAFTVMDLIARNRRDLAWRFLNRYLERTGDYLGLELLRYFLVYRAMVRAKVSGIRATQSAGPDSKHAAGDLERYLRLASSFTNPQRPFLAITHGLSGSGKSTVAGILAELAGAIRLRSDVERKRLTDLAMEQPSGSELDAGIYSEAFNQRTYRRLFEVTEAVLAAGLPAVVDATFITRRQRQTFLDLARKLAVHPVIIGTHAPVSQLRQWLNERQLTGGDASEAGERVLDRQLLRAEALDEEERGIAILIDTSEHRDRRAIERCLAPFLADQQSGAWDPIADIPSSAPQ